MAKKVKTTLTIHRQAEIVNPPDEVRDLIIRAMTLPNPKFVEAQKRGRYVGHLDPELRFYETCGNTVTFLRGFARHVFLALKGRSDFEVRDCRRVIEPTHLKFRGQLRLYQQEAVNVALKREHGILEMPTGAGKTTAALYMIAGRRQPTIVLVHNLELAHQWVERARQFLGIEAGLFANGKREIRELTIATPQTARLHLSELPKHFGHLVADEVHRAPAVTYAEVIRAFDCRYLTGLTATCYRNDNLGRLIYLLMGDRVYTIDRTPLLESGAIVKPEVVTRETKFVYPYADDFAAMLGALTTDHERNRQIIKDVEAAAWNQNGTSLIVSDRKAHLHTLAGMIDFCRTAVLTGDLPAKERARIVADLNRGTIDVLLSTTSLISEGFDAASLSTLFIASPIKFKGRLVQTAGRILRPTPGKKAFIFDYQDVMQPVLAAAGRSRARALAEIAMG